MNSRINCAFARIRLVRSDFYTFFNVILWLFQSSCNSLTVFILIYSKFSEYEAFLKKLKHQEQEQLQQKLKSKNLSADKTMNNKNEVSLMISNSTNRNYQLKPAASYATTAFSPYLITTTNTVYSNNHPHPQIVSQTSNLKRSCTELRHTPRSNKPNNFKVSNSNGNSRNISVNSIINSKLTYPHPASSLSRRAGLGHHHYNSIVGRSYSLNLKHERPYINIQTF